MKDRIQVSGIESESIVDGTGIRYTVFTQGCPHACEGCHNPQTHPFEGGSIVTVDEIVFAVKKNPLLSGVTLSGGEPFCQSEPLIMLARKIKAMGQNVWAWSGYTYEELIKNPQPHSAELLSLVDVLVDGRFVLQKRDLTLKFRGSANQRIIDCNETRRTGKIVLLD